MRSAVKASFSELVIPIGAWRAVRSAGPVYAGKVGSLHPRAAPKKAMRAALRVAKRTVFVKKLVLPGGFTPLKYFKLTEPGAVNIPIWPSTTAPRRVN